MCAAAAVQDRQQLPSGVEERVVDSVVGRGLFATRAFSEGDVIFEETPIVSCQFLHNKDYGYSACDHCLRPLESSSSNVQRLLSDTSIKLLYPECQYQPPQTTARCPRCQVQYCSEQCLTGARQQYHATLCTPADQPNLLTQLQHEWKQHHYPPETLSIMLVARLLAGVLQSDDPEQENATLSLFCHATQDLAQKATHKLLGEGFARHIDTLRTLLEQAIGAPVIAQWLSAEGFTSLLALVGSNGQGVGTSPLARWVNSCDELDLAQDCRDKLEAFITQLYDKLEDRVGNFLNTEGSALYRVQSRINHSCRPNTEPTFPHHSHRLVLEACADIAPGEQLYISYLDDCALQRSRHSRHALLRENYVFVCGCERCVEEEREQNDVTSDDDGDSDQKDGSCPSDHSQEHYS